MKKKGLIYHTWWDTENGKYIAIIKDVPKYEGLSVFADNPYKAIEELKEVQKMWDEVLCT